MCTAAPLTKWIDKQIKYCREVRRPSWVLRPVLTVMDTISENHNQKKIVLHLAQNLSKLFFLGNTQPHANDLVPFSASIMNVWPTADSCLPWKPSVILFVRMDESTKQDCLEGESNFYFTYLSEKADSTHLYCQHKDIQMAWKGYLCATWRMRDTSPLPPHCVLGSSGLVMTDWFGKLAVTTPWSFVSASFSFHPLYIIHKGTCQCLCFFLLGILWL